MNVIKFWSDLIEQYDDDERCGFCWKFYAPLTEIDLNLVKKSIDDCCVNVFITRDKGVDFDSQITYNNGLPEVREREMYDVWFLVKSKVGLNNYNEMPDHDVEESRHNTILQPLRECITFEILRELCLDYEVNQWSGKYVYDYQDSIYYGIKISITTRKLAE